MVTKKTVVKRSIPQTVVPLNEQTWLMQPVAVTTMRHDYDTSQTRVLVSIIEKMQDSIKKIMDNACLPEQLPLFTSNDFPDQVAKDEILLNISLKDFGTDKRRYKTLKEELKRLVTIPIELPTKDVNGKSYTHLTGLCEVFIEERTYVSKVQIKIKKQIAMRLIDTKSFGVHRYLKEVVFNTRNKYVQRFYMFISAWKQQGATPPVKMLEIRKMLRLENKYPRWDSFYDKVILGAMNELKEKADCGETDCYFSIEKIYKNGKSRGEPEAIRFFIHKSEAGKQAAEIMGLKSQKIKIQEFLKRNFDQSLANINIILKEVTAENIDIYNKFLSELDEKATQQGNKIKSLRSWAYTSSMRFFDAFKDEKQALDKKKEEELRQAVSPAIPTKEEQKPNNLLSAEEIELWNSFLLVVSNSMEEESFKTWITPIKLKEITQTKVSVIVPNSFFYEYLEAYLIDKITPAFREVFKGKELSYFLERG